MSGGNVNINLTQQGWYKFSVKLMLYDLETTDTYSVAIYKNNVRFDYLEMFDNHPNYFCEVNTFTYIRSDGNDIFRFYCESSSSDSFEILEESDSLDLFYNLITLEYISE
jgi:hypothetical protein